MQKNLTLSDNYLKLKGNFEFCLKSGDNNRIKIMNTLEKDEGKKFSLHNREWVFAFFGTAIGAGILFLPLQAGRGAFIPLVLAIIVGLPITYFSNKYLMVMCLYSKDNTSLNTSFKSFVGTKFGNVIIFLYFIMLIAILLAYGIGLSTDVAEALIQYKVVQFDIGKTLYLPLIILATLAAIVIIGEEFLLKVLERISMLLAALLFIVSAMLIPHWHLSNVTFFSEGCFWKDFFLVFPLITLSATYFPAVSPLVGFFKKKHGNSLTKEELRKNNISIAFKASCLLSGFIIFFLISTIFAMPQSAFEYANTRNISILAAIGQTSASPTMSSIFIAIGMGITILALISSYYGVLFGVIELLIPKCQFLNFSAFFNVKNNLMVLITIVLWLVVIFDWKVVNILGGVIAPIMGFTVFCLPTVFIFMKQELKSFRGVGPVLVFLFGAFLIVSFLVGLLM